MPATLNDRSLSPAFVSLCLKAHMAPWTPGEGIPGRTEGTSSQEAWRSLLPSQRSLPGKASQGMRGHAPVSPARPISASYLGREGSWAPRQRYHGNGGKLQSAGPLVASSLACTCPGPSPGLSRPWSHSEPERRRHCTPRMDSLPAVGLAKPERKKHHQGREPFRIEQNWDLLLGAVPAH